MEKVISKYRQEEHQKDLSCIDTFFTVAAQQVIQEHDDAQAQQNKEGSPKGYIGLFEETPEITGGIIKWMVERVRKLMDDP